MKVKILIYCAMIFVVQSCSLPEMKATKFNRDVNQVKADLAKLGDFEKVNIQSSSVTVNGNSTHTLVVKLINGKNLQDESQLNALAATAMKTVIDAIDNESDFSEWKVSIESADNGIVVSQSQSRSFDFSPADFK
jgi:hypothetical protein